MNPVRFLPLVLCLGCGTSKDSADSAVAEATDTGFIEVPERPPACDPEIRVDGVDINDLGNPAPGDSWFVLMYCDDTPQLGTYVLQADPAELVSIDAEDPIITFLSVGTVDFTYRVGGDTANFSVTIAE